MESVGMVAVVQGLQDAGLAVTLLSRQFVEPRGRNVVADLLGIKPANQETRTAVDTGTETTFSHNFPKDVGVNYRTNYQLTHCTPAGSSPIRTTQYPNPGFQHFRSCSVSRSHDEEVFVDSLRKYPIISPSRSRSADLIERMLAYTQNKNGVRYSNSKSTKSLPSKEASIHVQVDEIPTRDSGLTRNDNFKSHFGYKRDLELIPAVFKSNRKGRRENEIGMYDYMKSSRKDKKLKGHEVRYLTNVKQCLRERLRQMCDENSTTICPKIQSRYNYHRRQHHASENSNKCIDCKETQASTSLGAQKCLNASKQRSKVNKSPFKEHKACFCNQPLTCDCASQSTRTILKSEITPEELLSEVNKHKQCMSSKPTCTHICHDHDAEEAYKEILQKKVKDWVQEIPVYANISMQDRIKREEIINELIDSLVKLRNDTQYLEKAGHEIKNCLQGLPMWHPINKEDRQELENKLINNLLQKLESPINLNSKSTFEDAINTWVTNLPVDSNIFDKEKIMNDLKTRLKLVTLRRPLNAAKYKEALKSEVISVFKDLPHEISSILPTTINNSVDKLVERLVDIPFEQPSTSNKATLKDVILDWIKEIPQFSNDIQLNEEDNFLINDLVRKLNNVYIGGNTENRRDEISKEIANWFNSVEEKKKHTFDCHTKLLLKNQLIDKILDFSSGSYLETKNISDIVKKWFHDNPNTLGVAIFDDESNLDILIARLQELQRLDNEENRKNIMRKEILGWLQNLQRKRGKYIDSGTQENLTNKLLDMIRDESTNQKNNLNKENSLITQTIWEWLESQPHFPTDNSTNYRNMVLEFSNNLKDKIDEKGELTENDVKADIKNWIDKLAQKQGFLIDKENRRLLEDQLITFIRPSKKRRSWVKPDNFRDIVDKELTNFINDPFIFLKESDKEHIKEQITNILTHDLNNRPSKQSEKPIAKIIDILKQKTTLSVSEIEKVAHNLIKKINEVMYTNLVDEIKEKPLHLNNNLKEKLRGEVVKILRALPVTHKEAIVDQITSILANTDVNDKIFKKIFETLKTAELNETEAVSITKEVLDMMRKFKNGISESDLDTTFRSYDSMGSLRTQKQMFMQRLEQEITDFMDKILNEKSLSFGEKTSTDHFKNSTSQKILINDSPLKTSTPNTRSEDYLLNFPDQAETQLSAIQVDIEVNKSETETEIENDSEYKVEIKGIVRKWISNLELSSEMDKTYKDDMANDIAMDIIDREMYLQLSKSKISSQEEIEHLKYQIFKWTSKLPNFSELTINESKIKALKESLNIAKRSNLKRDINNLENNSKNDDDPSTDNYTNILVQDTNEFIEENIYGAILEWLNEIAIFQPRHPEEKRVIDSFVTELSQRLKSILSKEKKEANVENLCKQEIFKYLKRIDTVKRHSEEFLHNVASQLMIHLKDMHLIGNILERSRNISTELAADNLRKKNAIKEAIQNWCQTLPFKPGTTNENISDAVNKLTEAISLYLPMTEVDDNLDDIMNNFLNNLKQLPIQFDKKNFKILPNLLEKLIETLKAVLNDTEKYCNKSKEELGLTKPTIKKAVDIIYENIQDWCDKLPLKFGNTDEDIEKAKLIKENIAAKLLKKVGELNLDPEIFHDDFLYEDVLSEEIEQILNALPKSMELLNMLPTLKENLVKSILKAKDSMKNEMAGYAYKQQLRDAISKTLSSAGLSETYETSFEILKDHLADAFISLHYVEDDEELKNKFKEKIFNEVNKFCNDYLKRYPSSPLNASILNQELYEALKKVPMPKDESLRQEVDQIRIKDFVSDWFKDLPFDQIPSQTQENKIISVLAKRLHKIEKEAELNHNLNTDELMKSEISKWMKKFELRLNNSNVETATKKLINELKATKYSRKLHETTIRKSLSYSDLARDLEDMASLKPANTAPIITDDIYKFRPTYPPSSLSAEDRAHLQRIRERTAPDRTTSIADNRKDASVNPLPVATGIQTEEKQSSNHMYQKISQNASIQTIIRDAEQPIPITPQVIVKEYYWDSSQSPPIVHSGSILSCTLSPTTPRYIRQQDKISSDKTSHITTASQTLPTSPITKATITQEVSTEMVQSPDHVETSIQPSCLKKQLYNQGHSPTSQSVDENTIMKGKVCKGRVCQPCVKRPEISGIAGNTEIGTSEAIHNISQDTEERTNIQKCRPDCPSERRLIDGCLWDNNNLYHQPCFRRRIYEMPTSDLDYSLKHKRKNQQPSSCKSRTTKCTIRPIQIPCQEHKSCNTLLKHCPKCWEGFCPHPSNLYFR